MIMELVSQKIHQVFIPEGYEVLRVLIYLGALLYFVDTWVVAMY